MAARETHCKEHERITKRKKRERATQLDVGDLSVVIFELRLHHGLGLHGNQWCGRGSDCSGHNGCGVHCGQRDFVSVKGAPVLPRLGDRRIGRNRNTATRGGLNSSGDRNSSGGSSGRRQSGSGGGCCNRGSNGGHSGSGWKRNLRQVRDAQTSKMVHQTAINKVHARRVGVWHGQHRKSLNGSQRRSVTSVRGTPEENDSALGERDKNAHALE